MNYSKKNRFTPLYALFTIFLLSLSSSVIAQKTPSVKGSGTQTSTTQAPFPNGYYRFKSYHGTYLQSDPSGNLGLSTNASTWETFYLTNVGDGKITLKGDNKLYFQANPNGTLSVGSAVASTWETVDLKSLGGNKIHLKTAHGLFVQADPSGKIVSSSNSSTWETFEIQLVRLDNAAPKTKSFVDGYYSLKTHTGKYLQTDESGKLVAGGAFVGTWEAFYIKNVGNGRIAIKGVNKRFMQVDPQGAVNVSAANVGDWESYVVQDAAGNGVFLKSHLGTFLNADPSGKIGTAASASTWETFDVQLIRADATEPVVKTYEDGYYTLKAHTGKYLQTNQSEKLLAGGEFVGTWEAFYLKNVGNGKIALKGVNKLFVQADNNGNMAVETMKASTFETFTPLEAGNNKINLIAHTGKFVQAQLDGKVVAVGEFVGAWETFEISLIRLDKNEPKPETIKEGYYALKTHTGKYLGAKFDNQVVAENTQIGFVETFYITVTDQGKVRIKSNEITNKYLRATDNGLVSASGDGFGQWEEFTLQMQGNQQVRLQTWNRNYVQTTDGGAVRSVKVEPSTWETYTLVPTTKKETPVETGFRVKLTGLQCLQSADGGNNVDEIYFDVKVDGKTAYKIGPRDMNEASNNNEWEKLWDATIATKENNDSWATWLGRAKREFWLLPGTIYAKESVVIEMWEDDEGGQTDEMFRDDDDFIGRIEIRRPASGTSSDYLQEWNSEEEGHWKLAYTVTDGRQNFDPNLEGRNALVPVRVPVLSQGRWGACVAFSTVAALTTVYLNKTNPGSSREDLFDPLAFYGRRDKAVYPDAQDDGPNRDKSLDTLKRGGWQIELAMNELLMNGIRFKDNPNRKLVLKNYFVYNKNGMVEKVELVNGVVNSVIVESENNDGANKMRAVLKGGEPLIAGYKVYEDFGTYANYAGVYGGNITEKPSRSGHAVFLVGYNNPGFESGEYPSWILQNSWADTFGVNGLCTFSEGACTIDTKVYRIGDFVVE